MVWGDGGDISNVQCHFLDCSGTLANCDDARDTVSVYHHGTTLSGAGMSSVWRHLAMCNKFELPFYPISMSTSLGTS